MLVLVILLGTHLVNLISRSGKSLIATFLSEHNRKNCPNLAATPDPCHTETTKENIFLHEYIILYSIASCFYRAQPGIKFR
jgi:hypothetical protein